MSYVLEAQDLARHYRVARGWLKPRGNARALDGVSFTLARAKTLAVVGESGCGKSTLARQLTMIEEPTRGLLRIDGVSVVGADRATLRRVRPWVQMVFQNPYASLNPRKRVAAMLDEPLLLNTTLSAVERAERLASMMARVGLRPEHARRYPHMFSGGQRQRIAIARALMVEPRIVVADEPVSALDVSIQAQIINLLMDLQEDLQVAYVFISHNLAVVRHIADQVLVMYLGKVVEDGTKEAIFSSPAHPYTRALLASTPVLDPRLRKQRIVLQGELPSPLDPPPGCAFHRRCPHAAPLCRESVPVLRPHAGRHVACHRLEAIG